MQEPVTTILLMIMTAIAILATVPAVLRLRSSEISCKMHRLQYSLFGTLTVMSAGLIAYRMLIVNGTLQPLYSHVDGLVLLTALLCPMVLFLQYRNQVVGLVAFTSPLLVVLLGWAVCSSWWTFQPYAIDSVWTVFHLASVYLGTLSVVLAAVSGMMYLYVQRQIRRKADFRVLKRWASLEGLERIILFSSTLAFVFLTAGLVSGLIIELGGYGVKTANWWYSPKVLLAFGAWLTYALLMNVRYTQSFRGARAAWLSLFGLLLLMATFSAVTIVQKNKSHSSYQKTPQQKHTLIVNAASPWRVC